MIGIRSGREREQRERGEWRLGCVCPSVQIGLPWELEHVASLNYEDPNVPPQPSILRCSQLPPPLFLLPFLPPLSFSPSSTPFFTFSPSLPLLPNLPAPPSVPSASRHPAFPAPRPTTNIRKVVPFYIFSWSNFGVVAFHFPMI